MAKSNSVVAYREFSTSEFEPDLSWPLAIEPARLGLSTEERDVVMLAKTDGRGSLRHPGRASQLLTAVFGLPRQPTKLANPRLESLRRYAVAVALGVERTVAKEREQLVGIGFSQHQISAATTAALNLRAKPARGPWGALTVAMLIGCVIWAINRRLEEPLIAFIVAMAITTPLLVMARPRMPGRAERHRDTQAATFILSSGR